MALEIISAEDALAAGRKNREKGYPARGRDDARLLPFAEVASRPGFSFDADAKIFTAGSCFARNIERSLRAMDYNIVSSDPDFYNPFPDRQPFHRFNKYTVQSILNEFEWALGEKPMPSAALMAQAKDGLYCDVHTLGDSLCAPLDEMVKFRDSYNRKYACVADADVVMLTLGLVESWYDNATDLHLNRFPGATTIKQNPGRFALHVLDYDDILDALIRTRAVIAKHNPSFKMLVTVSPVPLDRTFRSDDILAANCYSKSVQRAAVEAFVKTNPVDYFPSYEVVTLTDHAYAWSNLDLRHVRGEMVDRLMGRFLETYTTPTERQSAQKTRGFVTAYLNAGDLPKAKDALDAHVAAFDLPLDLMRLSADISVRMGDIDSAALVLRQMIALVNADPVGAADTLDQTANAVLKNATALLDHCERLRLAGTGNALEMDHLQAVDVIDALLASTPDDPTLDWLKSYVIRSQTRPAAPLSAQNDKLRLIEAAALARLRGLNNPDTMVDEAQKIVQTALQTLLVSEELHWELATIYRKAGQLDQLLDLLDQIGRMGGSKAVQAVKHALPIARQLKRHDFGAALAEAVAKTL
jgi:tetratricopeptide (TPR) repeat protein